MSSSVRKILGIIRGAPKWINADKSGVEFRGYPYVGYCAMPNSPMIVLRAEALEHLLSIVERAEIPSHELLQELFVSRENFRAWLQSTHQPLPDFWYGNEAG